MRERFYIFVLNEIFEMKDIIQRIFLIIGGTKKSKLIVKFTLLPTDPTGWRSCIFDPHSALSNQAGSLPPDQGSRSC